MCRDKQFDVEFEKLVLADDHFLLLIFQARDGIGFQVCQGRTDFGSEHILVAGGLCGQDRPAVRQVRDEDIVEGCVLKGYTNA